LARAIHTEAECLSILTALQPGRNDVGNQDFLVHHLGELGLVEIAGNRLDAGEIGMRRGEYLEITKMLGLDQLQRGGRNNEVFVKPPQTAGSGHRGEGEERYQSPSRIAEPGFVEIEPAMRLVDNDEVDHRELTAHQSLDAGHLERLTCVGSRVIGLHDSDLVNALVVEVLDSLIDQVDGRDDEDRAETAGKRVFQDLDGDRVLPAPVGACTRMRVAPSASFSEIFSSAKT
jgi:hypothetical protein